MTTAVASLAARIKSPYDTVEIDFDFARILIVLEVWALTLTRSTST